MARKSQYLCYNSHMGQRISKSMVAASVVVVALLIGVVYAIAAVFGVEIETSMMVVQAFVTVAAISIAGVFAWHKLRIFGEFDPHITITQTVSHRRLGKKYTHIAVTASLKNSSKVSVEIRQAHFRLQQVAPLSDEEVETLVEEYSLNEENENHILWPTYSEINNVWSAGSFVDEPGEVETEIYEFIVPIKLERVLLYAAFSDDQAPDEDGDEKPSYKKRFERLWERTTVYDIT